MNHEPTPVGELPLHAVVSLARLREVALLFLKLGAISFGGPAAHIALMEAEVVGKRQWLTRQQFLDMLGAANLIPGPSSTELAINIGFVRAGWAGLCIAGASFILPAALITGGFAWAYVRFGALPQAAAALGGVKAAVISVIAIAIYRLGKTAVRNAGLAVLGVIALAAFFLDLNPIVILFGGGLVGMLAQRTGSLRATNAMFLSPTIMWRALIDRVGGESWAVSWRAAAAVAAVGPLVTRPALSRIALFF